MIEEIIEKWIIFMNNHYKTQTEAAEALGICRSHLNKIIHKKALPSVALMSRMEEKMKEYETER